jgi:hypothetical protein
MRGQSFALAVATLIYCFALAGTPAIAQAGSTGGTVGKQDKSISGSEEPAKPKSRPHKAASAPAEGKSKSSGCGNVVGTYKWYLGMTSTAIDSDGTTTNSYGGNRANRGNWTCDNGQVTIVWKNGYVDHLTPKPGGFSVVSPTVGQFDATRM